MNNARPEDTPAPIQSITVDAEGVSIRLAYERGKIEGYAECFADFRRIVREHGMEFIARADGTKVELNESNITFAEQRFIAQAGARERRKRP